MEVSQAWWHSPVIPAVGRLRQDNHHQAWCKPGLHNDLKASLMTVRPCFKTKQQDASLLHPYSSPSSSNAQFLFILFASPFLLRFSVLPCGRCLWKSGQCSLSVSPLPCFFCTPIVVVPSYFHVTENAFATVPTAVISLHSCEYSTLTLPNLPTTLGMTS